MMEPWCVCDVVLPRPVHGAPSQHVHRGGGRGHLSEYTGTRYLPENNTVQVPGTIQDVRIRMNKTSLYHH